MSGPQQLAIMRSLALLIVVFSLLASILINIHSFPFFLCLLIFSVEDAPTVKDAPTYAVIDIPRIVITIALLFRS